MHESTEEKLKEELAMILSSGVCCGTLNLHEDIAEEIVRHIVDNYNIMSEIDASQ